MPALGQTPGAPSLPTGRIIDSVVCERDAAESYALYLPSAYTLGKPWPIIYLFDPGADGARPVNLYKDIAEKYGYVLAGSNTSRNFGGDSSRSMTAIWQDTHFRLALDERRTYTSGFSGGARVAGSMALNCARCQIAGVIAYGAGYPSNRKLSEKDPLLYFFAVGDEDFNWSEVVSLRREREDAGLAYKVDVFSGGHQWAPVEVMEDAIEWMTLKSMQAGSLVRDAAFIDRAWVRAQQAADNAEKSNDAIARLGAYRVLVSDFRGLKDAAAYDTKLAALKKSAELKAAFKSEADEVSEQNSLEAEISPKVAALVEGKVDDANGFQRNVEQAISLLKDRSKRNKNEEKRRVAARALFAVWVQGIEMGQMQMESRHFEKAELSFQLMSQVNENPWPLLLLAETHASQGNKKQAVKDLREAVRRGMKDPDRLEKDDKLQSLKSDPEFQKIIEGLKGK
jgi:dienelactone hydrolase